jgi:predicted RNase H-like HicB family nuclease
LINIYHWGGAFNGIFVAYVPAIKGCHALGETPEEARSELQNVFDMIAEEYLESEQSPKTKVP